MLILMFAIHSYGTEQAIAKALKKSGVPRKELFITTKLWNNKHRPEDVETGLDDSLKNLGLEYVDLYLMHYPIAFEPGAEMFPKDKEGNSKIANIDYVEVRLSPSSASPQHRSFTPDRYQDSPFRNRRIKAWKN